MDKETKVPKVCSLIALILGLVGSVFLPLACFAPAYNVVTLLGSTTISLSKILGELIVVPIVFAGLGILYSLLKRGVGNIVIGSLSLIGDIAVFAWKENQLSNMAGSSMVSMSAAVYLVILCAGLILASGILYVVAHNAAKKGNLYDENTLKRRRKHAVLSIILSITAAVLAVGFFAFAIFGSVARNRKIQECVTRFMDAAVASDSATLNSCIVPSVKDDEEFTYVFNGHFVADAFLNGTGMIEYDELNSASRAAADEMCRLYADRYVQSYTIGDITVNGDGTATVTLTAQMLNEDDIGGSHLRSDVEALTVEYLSDHRAEYSQDVSDVGEQQAMKNLLNQLMPDMLGFIISDIQATGTESRSITLTLEEQNRQYLITEILVDD